MTISAETKSSYGKSDKEKIDLIYKYFENEWHCRYKYIKTKDGAEFSISSVYFSSKDEYSAVLHAVKQAKSDIKNSLYEKGFEYHPQLFDEVWNKYFDNKQMSLF